jgi:hypothetical protein
MNHWQNNPFVLGYGICNVRNNFIHSHLNFASDLFSKPRSYKRSMLLLFFNYIEMVFGFAVLYSFTNKFNKPLSHWFDSIYFSTVTSSTIGYGDLYPIDPLGKF